MKKAIAILLTLCLCVGFCACNDEDSRDKKDKKYESSAEVELCAELQCEIIEVCENYWKENIDRDDAQSELERIKEYMEDNSSINNFRSIVYTHDVKKSPYYSGTIESWFSNDTRELLKEREEKIKSCVFENRQDREVNLAIQVQKDLLEVFEKYWDMEIDGYEAGCEVSNILTEWEKTSKVLHFYDELDVLFSGATWSSYFLEDEGDASYYKERIESYNFK